MTADTEPSGAVCTTAKPPVGVSRRVVLRGLYVSGVRVSKAPRRLTGWGSGGRGLAQPACQPVSEVTRQRAYREQVMALGRTPLALGGEHVARDQAMQVDVLAERLAPVVQHRGHAEFAAQAWGRRQKP